MKIIVISMQSLTAINRSTFYQLSKLHQVFLYVPSKLKLAGKSFKKNTNFSDDGYSLHKFDLQIFSPLIYFSFDLIKKIYKYRHTTDAIVCDFEPATLLGLIIRMQCFIFQIAVIFIAVDDQNFNLKFNHIFYKPKNLVRNMVKRFLLIGSKNKKCIVTACNQFAITNYSDLGIRCSFMPLGYSSRLFKPLRVQKSKLIRIGMLGRIVKEKGAHILLEALTLSNLDNYRLVIDNFSEYGDSYKEMISNLIALNNLEDKIEFVNPDHDEMPMLINSLDIVVMPSISISGWQEQYGRIAVESLACGKPVIASSCGSLPFILGKYGLIFKERSSSELSLLLNNLKEIINNFDYKNAQIYAYNNYSDSAQAKILDNLIKSRFTNE